VVYFHQIIEEFGKDLHGWYCKGEYNVPKQNHQRDILKEGVGHLNRSFQLIS
jgi:hypothetical protein